ncbi:MAG: signal peptide peptidase SppA [Proteobacteria bacterium]|nr:signal peptide peptidase SppA [Pseudomonadota bacterium]MDA1022121.1 signal peptide peptidase SppA [Pseudomonadota bacterium]
MSLDADNIVERRRLKRRLVFWRVVGIVALVAAVLAGLGRADLIGRQDHVARININGIILDDQDRHDLLSDIAKNTRTKALIVKINSPGGTYDGGEALYQTLRQVADKKPIVTVMGATATSAGYMIALASDHIIARASTLTGSIGVIMQTADVTGFLEKLGIKPETLKSGPLKAQPNPLEHFTPAARKATEDVINDFFDMFVTLVAERRAMPKEQVLKLSDGRVYSGRQAKKNGLIDAIGSDLEARKWLSDTHKIAESLPIRDVEVTHEDQPWRDWLGSMVQKVLFSERLSLDGVFSLWHPALW